ncbi:hypothetical protein [Arthrobacter sp. JSM 101049]|uniref:hypothetical protein n=1 Tax=Arthrobacter sp. JSM 101049 TaxID=929097 RepID=UPI00356646DB
MSHDGTNGSRPAEISRFRENFNYIVGGIIAWGLIGWLLDFLLDTRWIWIVGALLGAVAGYYLAFLHRKDRATRPVRGADE